MYPISQENEGSHVTHFYDQTIRSAYQNSNPNIQTNSSGTEIHSSKKKKKSDFFPIVLIGYLMFSTSRIRFWFLADGSENGSTTEQEKECKDDLGAVLEIDQMRFEVQSRHRSGKVRSTNT